MSTTIGSEPWEVSDEGADKRSWPVGRPSPDESGCREWDEDALQHIGELGLWSTLREYFENPEVGDFED